MEKELEKINNLLNEIEFDVQELERRVLELEDRIDHSSPIGI